MTISGWVSKEEWILTSFKREVKVKSVREVKVSGTGRVCLRVKMIFGDATMQASLIERAEHRQIYRLVGLNHELEFWATPHTV